LIHFDPTAYRPATAAEVREIDRRAIEDFGIPGAILMENAGRRAAEVAAEMIGTPSSDSRIVAACGKGNNGGDGYVMARHLHNWGYPCEVFLTHPIEQIRGDARINLDVILKMEGIPVRFFSEDYSSDDFSRSLSTSALILDGLLGTGLSGRVRSPTDELITAINACDKPTLSIDTPSGLHSDTGEILGCCVQATRTVTFVLAKQGSFQNCGPKMIGALKVIEIGIPLELLVPFQIQ